MKKEKASKRSRNDNPKKDDIDVGIPQKVENDLLINSKQ